LTVIVVELLTPPELAVITVAPGTAVVARPAMLGALATVATLATDELQCAIMVTSCVLPSLNEPVAANCWVWPAVSVGLAGVTVIDTKVPLPTVNVVVPVMPDNDAEMVTDPLFFPRTMPVLRRDAILGFDDFHETPLRFVIVLPSLNLPVACNWIRVPAAIVGLPGVIVIDVSFAIETVRSVEPVVAPTIAEMVVEPLARLVASPALLIEATAGAEELQATDAVMSCVLLSLKVPVATNCFDAPIGMLEFAGVTAIETRLAPVTVTAALPVIDPELAFTLPVPRPIPVANPEESTVTTTGADDDHVTDVNIWVLPSSKIPVAINACFVPAAIVTGDGVTEMETRCALTTVRVTESVNDPTVAWIVVVPAPVVAARPEPLIVATGVDDEFQLTPLTKSWLVPSV
jgi:hypothetical protein